MSIKYFHLRLGVELSTKLSKSHFQWSDQNAGIISKTRTTVGLSLVW